MLLNKFWVAGSRHDEARSSMPRPPENDVFSCLIRTSKSLAAVGMVLVSWNSCCGDLQGLASVGYFSGKQGCQG